MSQQYLKYKQGSEKALNWLLSHLTDNGSYGPAITDMACYYKSPYLFYISGKIEEANCIASYIKKTFMRENGDLTTLGIIYNRNYSDIRCLESAFKLLKL